MASTPRPLTEPPDDDTLRIMIATDNHVGFMERDPIRGNDSFAALEEIFIRAREYHADMVLLGGDLFHENKPSRKTLHTTIGIFRRHCLNDNPVSFEVLSEQSENFQSSFGRVNYEDPNYSVGLPVFCIHGNHDDPTRDGSTDPLSALDLLSINNLINYFGTASATDNVEVNPVIIRKGNTYLALYGLGNMRDERLNRMWHKKKVKFLMQRETEVGERFYNLFVLHQNRDLGRGGKNCVQDSMIPSWMNMVVWGHEHQCLINPAESATNGFYVVQPGSSVATSLVDGEATPKHVGILEIRREEGQDETKARLIPVPLRNVRPFVLEEMKLADMELDRKDPRLDDKIAEILGEKVQQMIEEAKENCPEPAPLKGQTIRMQNFDKPLVRLKVEHTGFPSINVQRFGARFSTQVANPGEILLFHKSRKSEAGDRKAAGTQKATQHEARDVYIDKERNEVKVEDLVREQIENADKKLELLNEPDLHIALEDFVKKESGTAISDVVDRAVAFTLRELKRQGGEVDEEAIKAKATEIREKLRVKAEEQLSKREKKREAEQAKGGDDFGDDGGSKAEHSDFEHDDDVSFGGGGSRAGSTKSRATQGGKEKPAKKQATIKDYAKKSAAPAKGRKAKKPVESEDEEDIDEYDDDFSGDEEEEEEEVKPKAKKGAGRARKAAAKPPVVDLAGDSDGINEDSDEDFADNVVDDDDEDSDPGPVRRGKGRAKPATAAARGRGKGAAASRGKAKEDAPPAKKSGRVLPSWAQGGAAAQRGGASQPAKRARAKDDEDVRPSPSKKPSKGPVVAFDEDLMTEE